MPHLISPHIHNPDYDENTVAQYMNPFFILIHASLSVGQARDVFFERLVDDNLPAHIFLASGGRLAGMLSIRKRTPGVRSVT